MKGGKKLILPDTFFSNTLDPLVTKHDSKQVTTQSLVF